MLICNIKYKIGNWVYCLSTCFGECEVHNVAWLKKELYMTVSLVWENFMHVKCLSRFPCSLVSQQEFIKNTIIFSLDSYIIEFLSRWDYSVFHSETTLTFWTISTNFFQLFLNQIVLSCFSVFENITFSTLCIQTVLFNYSDGIWFVCGWILEYFKENANPLDHELNHEEISTSEDTYVVEIMYSTWGVR